MEIKLKTSAEKVIGHFCDVCGKSCYRSEFEDRMHSDEYATLSATWGYWSDKDLTWHECHMCEFCFDKVKSFIETELKGKVREGTYGPPGARGPQENVDFFLCTEENVLDITK